LSQNLNFESFKGKSQSQTVEFFGRRRYHTTIELPISNQS